MSACDDAKHTPGPWTVNESGFVRDGDQNDIAVVLGAAETWLPNGNLIAASPDLLAALESTTVALEQLVDIEAGSPAAHTVAKARAAIIKAKGGA